MGLGYIKGEVIYMLMLRINEIMNEKGISTRQLSEMTGIRWNTVDDMAKNKSKQWSPENLTKIMLALGVKDPKDIFMWNDKEGSTD